MHCVKYRLALAAAALSAFGGNIVSAATLTDTTYAANSNYTDTNGFIQSGTTTWTINPGVTVTATTGRFFVGQGEAPNTTDAIFVLAGGGTLAVTNTNAFAMRLGQDQNVEGGVLRIQGGTTVNFSGNQGPFSQESDGTADGVPDSRIVLSGLGSTLIAEGTYNAGTGLYNRGAITSEALPVIVEGGTLSSSYNAVNNVTTLSVVPEPASIAGLGLAASSLVFRRRRGAGAKR